MPLTDPVPSSAFDVLERNIQDTDKFVNQETGTFTNRVGKQVKPIPVIEAEANAAVGGLISEITNLGFQAVESVGWTPVGEFATGFTYTKLNDVGRDSLGSWWRYNGSDLPKVITAGTVPSSPSFSVISFETAYNVQWEIGKSVGYVLDDYSGVKDELYSQAGVIDSGTQNQLGNSQFVDAINIIINQSCSLTIAEAKSKTNFYEGQPVTIKEYGLSYKYTGSRLILTGQPESEMTYDDSMHILVTSGGMLNFDDWGSIPRIQSKNFAKYSGKIKDRTSEINIGNFGDSITFGQALPDTASATNRIGQPTNFGDGSTHEHWQFNNNYPQWISSYFSEHFVQTVNVNNLGYSGDRTLTGYLRHRESSGLDLATIMYGVNDCLFATSNGTVPQGISTGVYSVENYEKIIRIFAAKQIVNGASVVILGTAPFASALGYDGSQLAASRLVRAYNAAAKKVADELGCRYVDVCTEIFTQYGIMEITQEAVHLSDDGLKIVGQRISTALVTTETINEVGTSSILIANPNLNSILSKVGGNVLPNASSTTPRGTLGNDGTTMDVGSDWISIPFYASTDSLVAFFNCQIAPTGCVFEISLDNGALQSDFHFQRGDYTGKPAASKQITSLLPVGRETINISDDTNAFLHIANKGWHTLSIRKVSGVSSLLLDSITFESLSSVINSDMKGVTASCTVSSGVLSDSINIKKITEAYPSEWAFEFSNVLFNNKFTVIADSNETSVTPITYTVRYKSETSFGIVWNRFNGATWELFTPATFTVKVIGGR